ncbi:hypothetical protein LSAT2_032548 [Lamellibrachia satsuma]|nr:hypothetical protein LSAT2_032548 [Lamellibrachia satsuma]
MSFSSRVQIHGTSIRREQVGTAAVLKCYINAKTPYKMNTSTKRILLFVTIVACCVHESRSWLFDECDGQSYDSRVETCCENILWAGATPYDECCGIRVYDNRKYVCCDGELFSKREREQC